MTKATVSSAISLLDLVWPERVRDAVARYPNVILDATPRDAQHDQSHGESTIHDVGLLKSVQPGEQGDTYAAGLYLPISALPFPPQPVDP